MIYFLIVMMIPSFGTPDRSDLGSRIDSVLRAGFPENTVPGLAVSVSEGGRVLYQKGRGVADLDTAHPIDGKTRFRMASVSKQFTAMSVYRLIEQGKLTFDTRIGDVFDGLAKGPASVTIAHLMTHTSGLWDYETLIPDGRQEQVSDADVLEMIRDLPKTYFEPGSKFRYSNTGFCLLSLVVEKISGLMYPEFVRTMIFSPVGIPGAYLYEAGNPMADRAFGYRPIAASAQAGGPEALPAGFRFADQSVTSATKGDGCVYISAAEYHLWAESLMNGVFPSGQYLQDIDRMKQPVLDDIYYSMGWFVVPSAGEEGLRLFHSGETTGFRNIVYLNVSRGLCISIFSNRSDTHIAQVFEAIRSLLDEPSPVPASKPLLHWMSSIY